jgi:hypothetical protein
VDPTDKMAVLRMKMAQLNGRPLASPATGAPGATPTFFAPVVVPPVVFTSTNKAGLEKLRQLTALYKMDKITPAEYHRERAKIVPTL